MLVVRVLFGGFLILLSFIAGIYFRSYKGTLISHPSLFYLLAIAIGLIGLWLISSSMKKSIAPFVEEHSKEIKRLKNTGEKIELVFEQCEFKKNSYVHEVEDERLKNIAMLAPSAPAYLGDQLTTESVVQSALIYQQMYGDKSEKFISQTFPFDETALKFYVISKKIWLYVDRHDRTKYIFDLEN